MIWGAGYYGGKQLYVLGREQVAFFIDSNRDKSGSYYCGKIVKHPDDVSNLENYYIYVPFNYYDEIVKILCQKGLVENEDFEKYNSKFSISYNLLVEDYDRAIKEIDENIERLRNKVVFWGWNFSIKNNYRQYFELIKKKNEAFEYVVVGENIWMTQEEAESKNGVATIISPCVFDQDVFLSDANEHQVLNEDSFLNPVNLSRAYHKMKYCSSDKSEISIQTQILFMKKYIDYFVKSTTPQLIFTVGSSKPSAALIEDACCKYNIRHIYTHAGILYGTYMFDSRGDLGYVDTNINVKRFCQLPVDTSDMVNAQTVIGYLREKKYNRKVQPKMFNSTLNRIEKNKPTVLFTAQPEIDFIPYDQKIIENYSPNFKNSVEAGIFLSKICMDNEWNFIYKAHPISPSENIESKLSHGSIYIDQANIFDLIDLADVVVTIQSSTSYDAMIRRKPAVLLGYNHMRGKKCAYEAYEKENIEKILKEAIEKGIQDNMSFYFEKHIAQCLKYYLYDDLTNRELRYGKGIPNGWEEFLALSIQMSDLENNKMY